MKTFQPATKLKWIPAGSANVITDNAPLALTLNSAPWQVQTIDTIAFQLNAANTAAGAVPAGTFSVQGSLDYAQNPDGTVRTAGTFTSVTLAGSTTIAAAGTTLINLTSFGFPWVRVQWVPTSGDGLLNGFFAGRAI
jgi:hypothetical protein